MKTLYLMAKSPIPDNSGDAKRNLALLRAARSVSQYLHLITLPQAPNEDAEAGIEELKRLCDRVDVVGDQPLGHYMTSAGNRVRAILYRSYFSGVGSDPTVRRAVKSAIEETDFDRIVVSQLFMASAVPSECRSRVIYDSHNVHDIRLREAFDGGRVPRLVTELVVRRVRRQERVLVSRSRATVACSAIDAGHFGELCSDAVVETISNGATVPSDRLPTRKKAKRSVLFMASLDYKANIDSLRWFIDEIAPKISEDVEVTIVGSNPRPTVFDIVNNSIRNVTFLGHVADSALALQEAGVLIVPLKTGSGTRLKVLEAFATGTPVVSTAKGVEGLEVENDRCVLVRTTADDLASAATAVARSVSEQNRLREAAFQLLREKYAWPEIEAQFAKVLLDPPPHPNEPRETVA